MIGRMKWVFVLLTAWAMAGVTVAVPVRQAGVEPKVLFSGNWADPTIVRVGGDYYFTANTQAYAPSFLIWHSTDLRNWKPLGYASREMMDGAPELAFYRGRYYLYHNSAALWAEHPSGPWTGPIRITEDGKSVGIDPGHITDEEGNRFLYFAGGRIFELSPTGLRLRDKGRQVYEGWESPKEWETEGQYLEAPTLFRHGEWYYMLSAQGGTKGAATSHMAILARSKKVDGPWENYPTNPLLHTYSESDPWWSIGHATAIEGPEGDWYLLFHGYRAGFQALGRHTLIVPIEWTNDGWLKVADKWPKGWDDPITYNLSQNDEFERDGDLGVQWQSNKPWEKEAFQVVGGKFVFPASGNSLEKGRVFSVLATDEAYEVETELVLKGEVKAGLALYYSPLGYASLMLDSNGGLERNIRYQKSGVQAKIPLTAKTIRLKIVNDRHTATFFFDAGAGQWNQMGEPMNISELRGNHLPGLEALRPSIFAVGKGTAEFTYFRYRSRR